MAGDTARGADGDPLFVAEAWMGEGRSLAVATLIASAGEGGEGIGRRLVVDAAGNACGSLGGAALDAAARDAAGAVIANGEPQRLDFALPDGHACVYVERLG